MNNTNSIYLIKEWSLAHGVDDNGSFGGLKKTMMVLHPVKSMEQKIAKSFKKPNPKKLQQNQIKLNDIMNSNKSHISEDVTSLYFPEKKQYSFVQEGFFKLDPDAEKFSRLMKKKE